jgi:hypothetical protein
VDVNPGQSKSQRTPRNTLRAMEASISFEQNVGGGGGKQEQEARRHNNRSITNHHGIITETGTSRICQLGCDVPASVHVCFASTFKTCKLDEKSSCESLYGVNGTYLSGSMKNLCTYTCRAKLLSLNSAGKSRSWEQN